MVKSACEHAFSVWDVFYFYEHWHLFALLFFDFCSFIAEFCWLCCPQGCLWRSHGKCVIFSITMTALFKNACEHFPFFFLSKHVCAYSCLLQMVWACWQACMLASMLIQSTPLCNLSSVVGTCNGLQLIFYKQLGCLRFCDRNNMLLYISCTFVYFLTLISRGWNTKVFLRLGGFVQKQTTEY